MTPEVDEDEIAAELDALEGEMQMESYGNPNDVPSYLKVLVCF